MKATIASFKELPYTSATPELNLAKTGPSALTIGYVQVSDIPQLAGIENEGYKAVAGYTFSADYFPLNLNNPTFGPVFQQVYFRQAFQHLVDQNGWINAFEKGYAIPTYGLIPTNPANSFLSAQRLDEPGRRSTWPPPSSC